MKSSKPTPVTPNSLTHLVALTALALAAGPLQAATVAVPNASFEGPVAAGFPALPLIDSWQKTPDPGFPLPGGFTWDQLAGVFPNTPSNDPAYIDNINGNQAAYLISIPGVGISQDLSATYTAGLSYQLSVGLFGGGGITEGSSLLLGLYYRDGGNNVVGVGALPVTFTAAAFPTPNHFYDYSLNLPTVQAGDAWAGRNIGVSLLLTGGTGAGYWDVDNFRLVAVPEPSTLGLLALGAGGLVVARLRRRRV